MPEKQRSCNCVLVVLAKQTQQDLAIFFGLFYKTIFNIPLNILVGYKMIDKPKEGRRRGA